MLQAKNNNGSFVNNLLSTKYQKNFFQYLQERIEIQILSKSISKCLSHFGCDFIRHIFKMTFEFCQKLHFDKLFHIQLHTIHITYIANGCAP